MEHKELSIAIIDDGINSNLLNINLCFDIEVNEFLQIVNRTDQYSAIPNHGTICAGIIKKYSPNANIGSIRILNNNQTGDMRYLLTALKWCMENKIKVINISLGSCNYFDYPYIRDIVNQATREGIIMICATQNGNNVTYPASLSNAIGVKCDFQRKLLNNEYMYAPENFNGIDCIASSVHNISILEKEYITPICNSYAAPLITSKVYDIMQTKYLLNAGKYTIEVLKNYLCGKYKLQVKKNYKPDWIVNAVIINIGTNKLTIGKTYFNIKTQIMIKSDAQIAKVVFECLDDSLIDTIIVNNKQYLKEINLMSLIKIINIKQCNLIILGDIENIVNPYVITSKYWLKENEHYLVNNTKLEDIETYNIEVPIVLIQSNEECDILFKLKEEFTNNGYVPYCVSDIAKLVLQDIEYISIDNYKFELNKIKKYLKIKSNVYNADIILIQASDETLSKVFKADLNIIINETKVFKVDGNLKLLLNKNKSEVKLYNYIVDFFNERN